MNEFCRSTTRRADDRSPSAGDSDGKEPRARLSQDAFVGENGLQRQGVIRREYREQVTRIAAAEDDTANRRENA